ncbi:MAG: PstA family ABC transporter permease [Thermoleophilia bacterium]
MATTTHSAADVPATRPLAKKRSRPGDQIFHAAVFGALLMALGALAWLAISVLRDGLASVTWDFLTSATSSRASRAGFLNALKGSIVLMMITVVVAVPLGFAAATYLEKFAPLSGDELRVVASRRQRSYEARVAAGLTGVRKLFAGLGVGLSHMWARVGPTLNRVLEVNLSNLAAVPSIIYGLLGLALFVQIMGISKSLLAGGLTLAILVLPIIIIASREAIRAVPRSIEQGAMALGATRWQAIRSQVLPAALPGMLTGTILAMSRAIGETAPLVVVGGVAFGTAVPSLNPLNAGDEALFAMPLQIYTWVDQPQQNQWGPLAAAGIIVLLVTLVVMNLVAIWLRNRFTRRW